MTVEKVEQVRARNFQLLFAQFKDSVWAKWPKQPERGMLKLFAERLGMSRIYLSQINNNTKTIGTETRDRIEKAMNLKPGWMDTDHSQEGMENDASAKAFNDAVMSLYFQSPEAMKSQLLKVFHNVMAGKPLDE